MIELRTKGECSQHRASALIGRSPRADVQLADADVSRMHASVEWDDECWTIRDLASRNGTQVNGQPIPPHERRRLRTGDVIRIGRSAVVEVSRVSSETSHTDDLPTNSPRESDELLQISVTLFVTPGSRRVGVRVRRPDGTTLACAARSHFWLLVVLTEAREERTVRGGEAIDEGWVSVPALRHRLRLTAKGLDTWVWRARDGFRQLSLRTRSDVIERSLDGTRLRAVPPAIRIVEARRDRFEDGNENAAR